VPIGGAGSIRPALTSSTHQRRCFEDIVARGGLRFIAFGEEDCKTASNDEDGSDLSPQASGNGRRRDRVAGLRTENGGAMPADPGANRFGAAQAGAQKTVDPRVNLSAPRLAVVMSYDIHVESQWTSTSR
jgi:hypothetical protein